MDEITQKAEHLLDLLEEQKACIERILAILDK